MSDNLQQAWQGQSPARVTIETELLLSEVRRNQRNFAATIFWRDVREVGVAVVMVPAWVALGVKFNLPWTWYLMLPALLWIAGFMLAERSRQRKQGIAADDSLTEQLASSLAQVEHQILLLRNVVWWYILPVAAPAAIFFVQVTGTLLSRAWQDGLPVYGILLLGLILAMVTMAAAAMVVWIYQVNQSAVRTELEPRRAELQALLMSLQDETPSANGSSQE
jgi:hypothetical protein